MTVILAALALFVALMALWFASAGLKKMEAGSRELKAQINGEMDKLSTEVEEKVKRIDRRVGAFDGKLEGIIAGQAMAEETAAGLQTEISQVRRDLDDLLFSLPPNLRAGRPSSSKSEFG